MLSPKQQRRMEAKQRQRLRRMFRAAAVQFASDMNYSLACFIRWCEASSDYLVALAAPATPAARLAMFDLGLDDFQYLPSGVPVHRIEYTPEEGNP